MRLTFEKKVIIFNKKLLRKDFMAINVRLEKQEKAEAQIFVEIGEDVVDREFNKAIDYYKNNSRINGFRPGKAPTEIVKNKFKDEILERVSDSLKLIAYNESKEKLGLKTVGIYRGEVIGLKENQPCQVNLFVEIWPEIKIGNYKNNVFHKDEYEVSREDIEYELDNLRERYAEHSLKENGIVEDGDILLVKSECYDNGNLLNSESHENYFIKISKKNLQEEFYKNLINSKKGDVKEFEVKYSKDFSNKELAGKKVKYKILVKEIRKVQLPELNDDFAKEVGNFNSLKELEESIEKELKNIAENYSNEKLEDSIIENILNESDINVPESIIRLEANNIVNEYLYKYARQGINVNELIRTKRIDMDYLIEEAKKIATRNWKVYLMMKEIAKLEGLEVKDEEMDEALKKMAEASKMDFNEYKSKLSEDSIKSIRMDILYRKVMDFLKSENKIKKGKKYSVSELLKKS